MIKKLYIISILTLVLFGCDEREAPISNQDPEFDDFLYQTLYFPIQYPIRTIDLAEDSRNNNSIDLKKQFSIGVAVGGTRTNPDTRVVGFRSANDITTERFHIGISGTDTTKPVIMPDNYYDLMISDSTFTIPSGSLSGTFKVQLSDDFFNDPLSYQNTYYIPLILTDWTVGKDGDDRILTGTRNLSLPAGIEPKKMRQGNWDAGDRPKDFVLFMVKYINKYEGDFLLRGTRYTEDTAGVTTYMDTAVYTERDVISNDVVKYKTAGLSRLTSNHISNNINVNGEFVLTLDMTDNTDETSDIALTGAFTNANFNFVSGSGTYFTKKHSNAEQIGGEKQRTMYLQYSYEETVGSGTLTHEVFDTLVFRNTDTKFEDFTPVFY